MKLYKLTDKNGQTYGNTQWGEGVTHKTSGKGELCGPGWLHAYEHPLLAVLLNPTHANFKNPILWEAEGAVGKSDNGLKVGTTRLTTIKQIPLPEVTTEQRIQFAILCAKTICKDKKWNAWASDWLSGKDRSFKAAAEAAAWAARAAEAATWAAEAATRAAEAAAEATRATWAAEAAMWAAWAAARAPEGIDLIAIAIEATKGN